MIGHADFDRWLFGSDHSAALTPSDTGGLNLGSVAAPPACRRLYIGGSGNVKIDTLGGETGVIFVAVPVGMLDVHATRVYAAGTTATQIVALW